MTKNEIRFKQLIEEKYTSYVYIFHKNTRDINSLSNVPRSNIYKSSREPVYQSFPHLLSPISFAFHRATQYHLSSINIEIHVN